MKKCIVQHKDSNENYNFWCNSSWCYKCSTKDLKMKMSVKFLLVGIVLVCFVVREKVKKGSSIATF